VSAGPTRQAPLKLQAVELPELFPRLNLSEGAAACVAECAAAPDALAALEAGGFQLEAAKLYAHVLPKRQAVWWACMCVRHTAPSNLAEADRAALEAAEAWVRRQTDEVRRSAMDKAQRAGFATPEAWAAVAAFWSGDSMSPPDQPKVPPAPHLTGAAVGGAIAMAGVRGNPARLAARLVAFLGSAREIAAGGAGRLEPEKA
jgi:uncharacterized protein DUF6931